MDLWIRSQDRESIFKVKSIFYSTNNENEHFVRSIIVDDIKNGIMKLGEYATKERALEVLNEINRHIEELYNCKYGIEHDLSSFTYEMPKE